MKNKTANNVADIDWENWIPKERAALCFIHVDNQLMLIHKKTGLGKGKVNAPGGRIEPAETAQQAAVREVQEEIGLTPFNLKYMGELHFIFIDGYSLHGTIFFSNSFTGTPVETIEAAPFWCPVDQIPYENMWADDRLWLPIVLSGKKFKGYFVFDGEIMLSYDVQCIE